MKRTLCIVLALLVCLLPVLGGCATTEPAEDGVTAAYDGRKLSLKVDGVDEFSCTANDITSVSASKGAASSRFPTKLESKEEINDFLSLLFLEKYQFAPLEEGQSDGIKRLWKSEITVHTAKNDVTFWVGLSEQLIAVEIDGVEYVAQTPSLQNLFTKYIPW